jgi:hypothetical protein
MGDFENFEALLGDALGDLARRQHVELRAGSVSRCAVALWPAVVAARGVPARQDPDKAGEAAMARVADGLAAFVDDPLIDGKLIKQLLMALALPEFDRCRDSYLGAKRQAPAICNARVSGTHCVDCPYTVAFPDTAAHAEWLRGEWPAAPAPGDPCWETLVPGPWRELRVWVRAFRNR